MPRSQVANAHLVHGNVQYEDAYIYAQYEAEWTGGRHDDSKAQ